MNIHALRAGIRVAVLAFIVLTAASDGRLLAQTTPAPLNFAFAYSTFAYDDTSSLVQFDYQFSDRGLAFAEVDGRPVGRLHVRLLVWTAAGQRAFADGWLCAFDKPANDAEPQNLVGTRAFALPPGAYRAQLFYEDAADASRRDSATFDINVRRYSGTGLGVSDVLIASDVSESDDRSHAFYRGGSIVYPNILGTIEPPILLLNTYFEVYNADRSPASQFDVIYGIADSAGHLLYQREQQRNRPDGGAVAEMNSIVVDQLPSGDYFLIVRAFNGLHRASTDSATVVKAFSVVNPEIDEKLAALSAVHADPSAGVDLLYAGMSEEELDLEFKSMQMIATAREIEVWKSLSGPGAKGRFISDFWMRRDLAPETPEIETRTDFLKRRATTEALYREPMVDHGWQSDRGRVLLQYGKPDQIEREYMEKNRKPFEVWKYSRDNLVFAFVDKSQQGRFQLVHSNATGELSNESWETTVATIHQYLDQ